VKIEACILAGGLSRRMGRPTPSLRLGGRTLLSIIRQTARRAGLPVRVIRRDLTARSGPLGGIYTALKTTKAEACIFLACDMPFVRPETLENLLKRSGNKPMASFVKEKQQAGFPLVIPRESLATVERQLLRRRFSIQDLAKRLRSRPLRLPAGAGCELMNVNTPADWRRAQSVWRIQGSRNGRL
jgi:molybdopterin-guanine dinucleotide biosynthesis protein A